VFTYGYVTDAGRDMFHEFPVCRVIVKIRGPCRLRGVDREVVIAGFRRLAALGVNKVWGGSAPASCRLLGARLIRGP